MIQEALPAWPDPKTLQCDPYVVPHETLVKLGNGDAKAGRRLLRTLIDVEATREPIKGPTQRPSAVRIATESDEPAIMELLRLDHKENASVVAPFDAQHVQSFVYAATRERDATIGLVDEPEGPVGMVFLQPECWWFSPTWFISERLLFVHPDHRKSRHGRDLLRFAHWFVDDMSVRLGYQTFLVSTVVGTQDADRKAAIFGRMMERAGGVFVYPSPSLFPPF